MKVGDIFWKTMGVLEKVQIEQLDSSSGWPLEKGTVKVLRVNHHKQFSNSFVINKKFLVKSLFEFRVYEKLGLL